MAGTGRVMDLSLTDYIEEVSRELAERVEHQRQVLLRVIEDHQSAGKPLDYCVLVDCGPRRKYRAAVEETIRVLEETRRSFKSRQLEELRKSLQGLLAEDAARTL